ncbi:hypothetical protein G7046_g1165 [Stylonectria norvegica]|nr:hypothetical protein G7046_g1165 [Stylonectria norvegica]
MNSLKVPEAGLLLEGSAGKDSAPPPQAFALTLSDNVIENMIQCVRDGGDIQLTLGANPTFKYGSNSHAVAPPTDSYPHELFLTRPFESTRKAEKLANTGSLFSKPKSAAPPTKTRVDKAENVIEVKTKNTKTMKSNPSSGVDSGIEALQSGLAAHEASREKARMVAKLPATKKAAAKAKGKLLSGYASTPRSMPASPNPVPLGSPSLQPTLSASQQHMERIKEQRSTFVHELAVQEQTLDYLKSKWTGKDEDMRPTLEKVADFVPETKTWRMTKTHWKELDVWKYDYDTQELRQTAIENAIRQYDKQRFTSSQTEWQRLLPMEERGQGKCLSRLQAGLAKVSAQAGPRIMVQRADGSSTPQDDMDSLDIDYPSGGGTSMSRSTSNPIPAKPKKLSGSAALSKRLLSNSKAKTSKPTPKATTKATPKPAPKTSPTKPKMTGSKAAGPKANGGRVLSKEIIENSDSSGDDTPVKAKPVAKSAPKPVSKPVAKLPAKPVAKPVAKQNDTVATKPRPVAKESTRQPMAKRPREDDDSSSNSEAPLAKRAKPAVLPGSRLKHRPSDASQNSRGTANTSSSLKSKTTSPAKSSPLASSPPTNASDLENEVVRAPPMVKKRKAVGENKQPPSKRSAVAPVSSSVMDQAHKFKVYYQKYETLHYEIAALEAPPTQKLEDLNEMRDRLLHMKREIYRQCPPSESD